MHLEFLNLHEWTVTFPRPSNFVLRAAARLVGRAVHKGEVGVAQNVASGWVHAHQQRAGVVESEDAPRDLRKCVLMVIYHPPCTHGQR